MFHITSKQMIQRVFGTLVQPSRKDLKILVSARYPARATTVWKPHQCTLELSGMWKWKSLSCVQLFVIPWTTDHGILQARILEWVAFPFSKGSSQTRDRTRVSCIVGRLSGKHKSFALSPLSFQLRTFRLWDWSAAYCAKEAPVNLGFYNIHEFFS